MEKDYKGNFAAAGFTLVELLVAVGLFSIIVSIAVGGFVSAMRIQRQTSGLLLVNGNASLVMEQIARELRTGYEFCSVSGRCISTPTDTLTFKNAAGEVVTYCLDDKGTIERGVGSGNCGDFDSITADNIFVKNLSFITAGLNSSDSYPPKITVSFAVASKEAGVSGSYITLQTTVSSRVLDG